MVQKTLGYQIGVKRIIAIPFLLVLFICLVIYTLVDLTQTVQSEIKQASKINYLIAQSTASNPNSVTTASVDKLLSEMPQYESIVFFPFDQQQHPTTRPIKVTDVLFERYYGLSEPVKINLLKLTPNQNNTKVDQLIGYSNLTLDLQTIRQQWFWQHLPLMLVLSFIALFNLWFVVQKVQHLTHRLPKLEDLSHQILQDEFSQAEAYQLPNSNEAWVFEKALMYLLNKRKAQIAQINTLRQEKNSLEETQFKQLEHSSKFENILIHEFKSSVSRIESGLQLLHNQYISAEQKDAVEIITLGKDDLNAKLDQIIQINRIDKGQTGVGAYQFSPTALITQIVNDYQPFAAEKNITLTAKPYHADYVLEGDIQKITLIISSLVENAIKFTDKGSITITSQLQHLQTQVRWMLQIEDTGIGIAKEHLEQIFEPFFQISPEVKHTSSNNSAGLFLVKKLLELMKGGITVTSEPNVGTNFQVSLLLKDWKHNYERNLLINKHIVVWYHYEDLFEKAKRMENAGAKVETFTSSELLEDYLSSHTVDALFISRNIHYQAILDFVSKFRERENKARVTIICVYDTKALNPHTIELLKIAGVDYFVKKEVIDDTLDQYIKELSHILS